MDTTTLNPTGQAGFKYGPISFLKPAKASRCLVWGASLLLSAGCQIQEEAPSFAPGEELSGEPTAKLEGRVLFESFDFAGNGRTCATCHAGAFRSLTPQEVQTLFIQQPSSPLFQLDSADNFGTEDELELCLPTITDLACDTIGWAEGCRTTSVGGITHQCTTTFRRFLTHATIRVPIELHEGVSVLGQGRTVFVNRAIPTTVDTALEQIVMSDGRAPDLESQAADALAGHAQTQAFSAQDLAEIAAFERTEFSSAALALYAAGGPAPELPAGITESQKRGRSFFETPAESGKEGFCAMCHGGPMLNEITVPFEFPDPLIEEIPGLGGVPGERFVTALVSEVNTDQNPVYVWTLTDDNGVPRVIASPDIGRAAITGRWRDVNRFKIPSLWGTGKRAPYFHDNSAKSIQEMVDHYANFAAPTFRIVLTLQDRADIAAYMALL